MIDFCILGSGISGSTIANLLAKKYSVKVFDKARGPGGRSSNKRFKDNLSFDHGVQYVSPKSKEFSKYIDKTYDGHYSSNKFQSTEVIIDRGHGTGFCMGNVDKYSNRYGKKGTRDDARKDLMKILHYALIQLYVHDNDL